MVLKRYELRKKTCFEQSFAMLAALITALAQPMFTCQPVNRSLISSFCHNDSALVPSHTCQDGAGFHYHTTREHFEKQAHACSTEHKRKEMCPNEPNLCRVLTFDEYCGKYDQSCSVTAECLPYCWDDCYPCNDKGDCETLEAFGVLAAPKAPCFSIYHHAGELVSFHSMAVHLREERQL
jgi:hypothetical protein